MEWATNVATALRRTNRALGIVGALILLNHLLYCRFERCARAPFLSCVGAAETREISNLENTLLACATTLITASFLLRYTVNECTEHALQISLLLPFVGIAGFSFDTKRHKVLHVMLGQLATVLVAVLALKGSAAVILTAMYCFLLTSAVFRRKRKDKDYSLAERFLYQANSLIQSALIFTFGYAIIARNTEIAKSL